MTRFQYKIISKVFMAPQFLAFTFLMPGKDMSTKYLYFYSKITKCKYRQWCWFNMFKYLHSNFLKIYFNTTYVHIGKQFTFFPTLYVSACARGEARGAMTPPAIYRITYFYLNLPSGRPMIRFFMNLTVFGPPSIGILMQALYVNSKTSRTFPNHVLT